MTRRYPLYPYFDWLCAKVDPDEEYKILLRILYNTRFVAYVPHDDNRAMDGLAFRSEYCLFFGEDESIDIFPSYVSVLEVLLALAERMHFCISEADDHDDMDLCFWEMIGNLDVLISDKEMTGKLESEIIVKIDDFVNRKYAPNGEGGIFPLRNCSEDQRSTELWYQMNFYINQIHSDEI